MKLVIQRVQRACLSVAGRERAAIGPGLAVLVGVARGDTVDDAAWLAGKTARLRIFDDDNGQLNQSAGDAGAEFLVVSQFTLYGDCRKGNRPSYIEAAPPDEARALYEEYVRCLAQEGCSVQTGCFQEHMVIELVNDGPVTILVESRGR